MEAVRFTLRTKKLELAEIPIPKITKPNEVLIKIAYSGICGTDLHIMQGEFPCDPDNEFTLGHEFSGIVLEVGPGVKNVKVGDKVSADPNDGCGCCKHCHSGNPHFCSVGGINDTIGIWKNGGWAKYTVAPAHVVHKLPDSVPLDHGALTEPLSCLAHGLDLVNPITIGTNILVMGAGIIGSLWACVLHLQGHKRVTVSEPNLSRLNMIKKLNLGYTLLTPDELRQKRDNDPDYSFDLVIDCSGYAPAIEYAVSLLGMGGRLCCFGVAPPHAKISISPFDLYKRELSIFSVNINPYCFPKAISLLEALGDRYLSYENLGIRVFSLKQYEEAIELLKRGEAAKVVFKM